MNRWVAAIRSSSYGSLQGKLKELEDTKRQLLTTTKDQLSKEKKQRAKLSGKLSHQKSMSKDTSEPGSTHQKSFSKDASVKHQKSVSKDRTKDSVPPPELLRPDGSVVSTSAANPLDTTPRDLAAPLDAMSGSPQLNEEDSETEPLSPRSLNSDDDEEDQAVSPFGDDDGLQDSSGVFSAAHSHLTEDNDN